MRLSERDIAQQAAATGYPPETLEKVFRLLDLLAGICRHPFLKTRVALKGGTALNLFTFDIPRLSVDIDLNYIGATERKAMLADVPKVTQAVQAICGREDISYNRGVDKRTRRRMSPADVRRPAASRQRASVS